MTDAEKLAEAAARIAQLEADRDEAVQIAESAVATAKQISEDWADFIESFDASTKRLSDDLARALEMV